MDGLGLNYFNRVKYELYNELFGTVQLLQDPKGWDSDSKEIARNEDYLGISSKFSNNLEFFGDGAEFIRNVKDVQDIRGQIILRRYERHPKTDEWTQIYWGHLDLSTYSGNKSSVKVKFNSGGLEQAIKNRESEDFEIDRLTTVNGVSIPDLNTIKVNLDGRRIFLKSTFEKDEINNEVTLGVESDDGNTRSVTASFPMKLKARSHEEVQSPIGISLGPNDSVGVTGLMFFAQADRDKNVIVKGSNIKFRPKLTQYDYDWIDFRLCLTTYKDGDSYNVKNRINLWTIYGDFSGDTSQLTNNNNVLCSVADFEMPIQLLKGESIALEFLLRSDIAFGENNRVTYTVDQTECNLSLEENSIFVPTSAKAVLMHELIDRLVTICADKKNVFKSDYYGRTDIGYVANGKGAFTGLMHGFWTRGFEKDPNNKDDRFKPITTNLREAIENAVAIHNVSMGIETINNVEKVVVEDIRYFFRDEITIKLKNPVKNVVREPYLKMYYDAVEFGSSKGGNYEEANGLDEPNTKSRYTTVFSSTKNTYSKVSNYRFDSTGHEFCRRKQYLEYPTTDTSYDGDIFCLDLKPTPVLNIYGLRKWQDDFNVAPEGVFSPETGYNFRYSPLNIALRHSNVFSGCLKKFQDEYLRYASTENNSNLTTELRTDLSYKNDSAATVGNGYSYTENGNIHNSELKKGFIYPEKISFEHVCDFDIMEQLNGFSVIDGKRIPNFYGKVEFTNEYGELEYGWILSVKPNGSGQWEIVKSNQ